MAARLTWRVWPEAALSMTPHFSGHLLSLWATWFFKINFSLFFTASWLCLSLLCLCPPPTSEPSGPECGGTTNPNSGYKLQTCLWRGSACSPLGELLQQTPLSPLLERHDPNFTLPNWPFGRLQWDSSLFTLIQQHHPPLPSLPLHFTSWLWGGAGWQAAESLSAFSSSWKKEASSSVFSEEAFMFILYCRHLSLVLSQMQEFHFSSKQWSRPALPFPGFVEYWEKGKTARTKASYFEHPDCRKPWLQSAVFTWICSTFHYPPQQ